MITATYSAPLILLSNGTSSGSPYEVGPVPVNTVTVIRDVSGIINIDSIPKILFYIKDPGGDLYYFYVIDTGVAPSTLTPFHWEGRVVVPEGYFIGIVVDSGDVWACVSGYQLTNY